MPGYPPGGRDTGQEYQPSSQDPDEGKDTRRIYKINVVPSLQWAAARCFIEYAVVAFFIWATRQLFGGSLLFDWYGMVMAFLCTVIVLPKRLRGSVQMTREELKQWALDGCSDEYGRN